MPFRDTNWQDVKADPQQPFHMKLNCIICILSRKNRHKSAAIKKARFSELLIPEFVLDLVSGEKPVLQATKGELRALIDLITTYAATKHESAIERASGHTNDIDVLFYSDRCRQLCCDGVNINSNDYKSPMYGMFVIQYEIQGH